MPPVRCVCVAVALILTVSLRAAPGTEADAIRDFGIRKSEPIVSGRILYFDTRFVDPPLLVERRGLDVYVNDVFVGTAAGMHGWPPPDLTLRKDPGAPPAGISPFAPVSPDMSFLDCLDTYWSRKWRYLATQYPFPEAVRRMADVYRESSEVKSAKIIGEAKAPAANDLPADPTRINVVVELKDGGTREVKYTILDWKMVHGQLNPPKEDLLKRAEEIRLQWVDLLSSKGGLIILGQRSIAMDSRKIAEVMRLLLSRRSADEKVKALTDTRLLTLDEETARYLVRYFRWAPTVQERLTRLEDELSKQAAAAAKPPPVPEAMRALTQPRMRPSTQPSASQK